MNLPEDHPIWRVLDQVRPTPPADQDQVQQRVRAYLHARGQALAQDLDLGHVQDQDLIALGRLDSIGRYPDAPPDVAPILAMITDQRQDQDHRPSFTREEPDISDIGVGRGLDQGQGDHAVRGGPESPVQNGDLVLARKVAQIPEKSRETIIGRLKDKGQDPSPATILREWDYHVAITTDYPDQDWS